MTIVCIVCTVCFITRYRSGTRHICYIPRLAPAVTHGYIKVGGDTSSTRSSVAEVEHLSFLLHKLEKKVQLQIFIGNVIVKSSIKFGKACTQHILISPFGIELSITTEICKLCNTTLRINTCKLITEHNIHGMPNCITLLIVRICIQPGISDQLVGRHRKIGIGLPFEVVTAYIDGANFNFPTTVLYDAGKIGGVSAKACLRRKNLFYKLIVRFIPIPIDIQ